jgi:hypothetical protein
MGSVGHRGLPMHDAELDTPKDEVLRMEAVHWEELKAEM